jgi:hypothetical protein
VDSALEIAKWPEWGVEKWEETDSLPQNPASVPLSKNEQWEPKTFPEDPGQPESQSEIRPANQSITRSETRPGIFTRTAVLWIVLGVAAGFLFLGGLFFVALSKTSSTYVLAPAPRPPAPATASLDLAPETVVPAIPPDIAHTSNAVNAVPLPQPSTMIAEESGLPQTAAAGHRPVRPPARRVRLSAVQRPNSG